MLVSIGDELWIGKTVLQFESPSKTALKNAGQPLSTDPAGINQEKSPTERTYHAVDTGQTHNASFYPKSSEGWTLRNLGEENGNFALINHNSSVYKKLNKRSVHMWKLMDGQHSLYDILVDYLNTFHSPGADRLIDLVDELAEKGFLQNVEPQPQPSTSAESESTENETDEKAPTGINHKRFLIQGIDEWLTKIYTAFAWRLFTRTGKFLLAAIALSGFVAFLFVMFQNDYSLFRVRDSFIGGFVVIGLSHLFSIFIHKLGHALVVKSYHRHVRQAGFMMDHGFPTFFVDSSDIWLEPKGPRIHASMAGPYANFLVGSIASLVIIASPNTLIDSILFILAAWSNIVAFFHLNPMLNLDGYFTLMDVMEIPQLRKRSIEFMRKDLWKKLWKRESFSKEEINYALFSILSFLWILIAARVIFIYIRPLWRKLMTPGFDLFKS